MGGIGCGGRKGVIQMLICEVLTNIVTKNMEKVKNGCCLNTTLNNATGC